MYRSLHAADHACMKRMYLLEGKPERRHYERTETDLSGLRLGRAEFQISQEGELHL